MKRTFTIIALFAFALSVAYAGVSFTSAKIYKQQGDFAKAMEFYDQAATEEPDNAEVFFQRGELLGIIAMENAHIGLRKKIAGESENPKLTVLQKMVADFDVVRGMKDDKKAKKALKKIDEITQGYWWDFYSVAVDADSIYKAKHDAGETEGLENTIKSGLDASSVAIMLDPSNWSSRFVYAQLKGYQEKDDTFISAWEDAIAALENSELKTKQVEDFTNNRRYANLQLIQYYYSHEDYKNTLLIADRMMNDEPGLVEAVQYKAYALATMANDEKRSEAERDSLKHVALSALVNAKDSNPDDENIIYYIGQFNLQLKDTAAALSAFDEYLTKVPDDGIVLAMQGVIYLEGEKFADLNKAIEKLRAAKDADTTNGAFWTNYGIALLRNGQNEEGAAAMAKGNELSGN